MPSSNVAPLANNMRGARSIPLARQRYFFTVLYIRIIKGASWIGISEQRPSCFGPRAEQLSMHMFNPKDLEDSSLLLV